MLPFNTTIPAVIVAVLGFTAGALVFSNILSEPTHSVAVQDAQPAGLRAKPKQAVKTPSGATPQKTNAATGQRPQG